MDKNKENVQSKKRAIVSIALFFTEKEQGLMEKDARRKARY
jgi:hypothetical protein